MQRNNSNTEKENKLPTKHHSTSSYFLAAATAGAGEIGLFHPLDTVAKRFQNHKGLVTSGYKVIFPTPVQGIKSHIVSLYKGLGFAAIYKVAQRTIKFGGQPIIDKTLNDNLSDSTQQWLGSVGRKGVAGSLAGIAEVAILPFDAMKIKFQTGTYVWQGFGNFLHFVAQENFKLYNGAMTTIARNAPGSFVLFGTDEVVKKYLLKLDEKIKPTVLQNFVGASAGSIASVLATLPLDVIKTRIQATNGKQSTLAVIKATAKEGPSAFFKGGLTKAAMAAPKVAFTMTVAPLIMHNFLNKNNKAHERKQCEKTDSCESPSLSSPKKP